MQRCKFCGESDECKLILSSRFVNGKVVQELICFRCFWLDKFQHEDGDILSEEFFEQAEIRAAKARSLHSFSLSE